MGNFMLVAFEPRNFFYKILKKKIKIFIYNLYKNSSQVELPNISKLSPVALRSGFVGLDLYEEFFHYEIILFNFGVRKYKTKNQFF